VQGAAVLEAGDFELLQPRNAVPQVGLTAGHGRSLVKYRSAINGPSRSLVKHGSAISGPSRSLVKYLWATLAPMWAGGLRCAIAREERTVR
jgi:hypothetical protein